METIPINFEWEDRAYEGTAEPVGTESNGIYYHITAPGINAAIEPVVHDGVAIKWVNHDTQEANELTYILGAAVEKAEVNITHKG